MNEVTRHRFSDVDLKEDVEEFTVISKITRAVLRSLDLSFTERILHLDVPDCSSAPSLYSPLMACKRRLYL